MNNKQAAGWDSTIQKRSPLERTRRRTSKNDVGYGTRSRVTNEAKVVGQGAGEPNRTGGGLEWVVVLLRKRTGKGLRDLGNSSFGRLLRPVEKRERGKVIP